jgi:hypothetical protein
MASNVLERDSRLLTLAVKKLLVKELQVILRAAGLSAAGRKDQLQGTLTNSMSFSSTSATPWPSQILKDHECLYEVMKAISLANILGV